MKKALRTVNWWFVIGGMYGFLSLIAVQHIFPPPSVQAQQSGHQGKHVATAVTTPVKDGLAFLNSVTINGGTAGVVTIYDIAASGCTGTPGSGTIAVIEAIGATSPVTLFYDIRLTNGLCIVTAAATDLTLSYD
jgi:hypothetical protein